MSDRSSASRALPSRTALHHNGVVTRRAAPFRVVFVCTGNICRSPMAEIVFRDVAERAGLDDRVASDLQSVSTLHVSFLSRAADGRWSLHASTLPAPMRASLLGHGAALADISRATTMALDGEDYHEALVSWFDDAPPQLARIPRGTHLAAALADSPAHARLAWFTNGVLRYDQLGEQLVVTDIRLGMTGFHPFRFAFATWRDGQWQPIEQIERLPVERGDLSRLQLLWSRIWQPEVQVPLLAWANELRRTPLASSGGQ